MVITTHISHGVTRKPGPEHKNLLSMVQVHVPDMLPGDGLENFGRMRMSAGDFVEVYSAPGQAQRFDCVVTCFFLDTAHNVLQYLEIISHILKVRSDEIDCMRAPSLWVVIHLL